VFLVDGVRAIDESNPTCGPAGKCCGATSRSPATRRASTTMARCPHGSVHYRTYRSTQLKTFRNVAIYVPPRLTTAIPAASSRFCICCMAAPRARKGWVRLGRVPAIEENLLARHQAVPMLVVNAQRERRGQHGHHGGQSTRSPGKLFDDIVPLVEKN